MTALPDVLNVLDFRGDQRALERIREVDPRRLNVIDMSGEFGEELAREWGSRAALLRGQAVSGRTAAELDAIVRDGHVMLLGIPFPKNLPTRAHNLLWAHFTFAGVSNLMGSDWWGLEGPVLTSARGFHNALPIAETAVAAALMFSKRLDQAVLNTQSGGFGDRTYAGGMSLVAGKTMGIVGLGGIGAQLARLSRGLDMRVVATRRSAASRQRDVEGVDELFPSEMLTEMLAECDFVAICAMWTPETEGLINARAFAAMKPGAFLLNIARGEIIDEDALVEALNGGHLGGAYLDVWHDDIQGAAPQPALRAARNVVFTPHVSGRSDVPQSFSLDLFIANLDRLLSGEPLINAIDWSRGY